ATFLEPEPGAVNAALSAVPASSSPTTAYLEADAVGQHLLVRPRRPGDALQPLGMAGHRKKVQDLLVDAHVPREARDRVPIVLRLDAAVPSGTEIVWVAGHCLAEPFKVTDGTRRLLCLQWEPLALSP